MKRFVLFLLVFTASRLLAFEARVWAAETEKQVIGIFSRELLGGVQVRDRRGRARLLRFDELTAADRNYIKFRVPPEVSVDLGYKTRMLQRTELARDDDFTTLYTFTVSVDKKSKLPYLGTLTVELFIIGNERLVDDGSRLVLMDYRINTFEFPEGKDARYEFIVPDIPFNTYRAEWVLEQSAQNRGKTYQGAIVAVFDKEGGLIVCKSDFRIDWLTDNLSNSIEKLRRLYKEFPGHYESRHFNSSFIRLDPPRIPWFRRSPTYF